MTTSIPCTMRNYMFVSILMWLPFSLSAQNDSNPLKVQIIPPAPEAASIGKYIDMPVSQYTGLPKIEVPIYDLKSYELKLPISLSYHASGLKVEEVPSSVGAGWALNAGGVVSRTIRGLNDEHQQGYFSTASSGVPAVAPFFSSNTAVNSSYFLSNVLDGGGGGTCNLSNADAYKNIRFASRSGMDLEPDLFFFSLPDGQSGKFVYDRSKSIHMIPKQYADITYTLDVNGAPFATWIVYGKDGTKYTFQNAEITNTYTSCGIAVDNETALTPPVVNAPSSWYLTKMESANGLDYINFEYVAETQNYNLTVSETSYDALQGSLLGPSGGSTCSNATQVAAWRLSRIVTKSNYSVEFKGTTNRNGMTGGKNLDQVIVKYDTNKIKTFDLVHSGSLLASVQERVGSNRFPAYLFTYNGGAPNPTTKGIDHWGYYNGVDANTTKSPSIIYNNQFFGGADREASLAYCTTGALTQIQYPTGGVTQLEYELNDYSNIPGVNTFQYTPGLDPISSIEFTVSNPSLTYSDSKTFTVAANTNVIFMYVIPLISGGGVDPSACSGSLTKTSYSKTFVSPGPTNPMIEVLGPGTYTFSAVFKPSQYTYNSNQFYIKIYRVKSLSELVQSNALKGGGLRIKSITNVGDNTITKTYSYTYKATGLSSGKLATFPVYGAYATNNDGYMSGPSQTMCVVGATGTALARSSASNIPLGLNQGSHVGYDEVTEYIGTATVNNGYSVYRFTNFPDVEPSGVGPPSVAPMNFSYKNGLLLEKEDYTTGNRMVKKIINSYTYTGYEENAIGIRVSEVLNTACIYCPNRRFAYNYYLNQTEKVQLISTQTLSYGTVEDAKEDVTLNYLYDGYDQVVVTDQTTSLGSKRLYTSLTYHPTVHTAVATKYTYYGAGSRPREYKSGQLTGYHGTYLKPNEIQLMETTTTTWVSGTPPLAQRLIYTDFDSQGNVLSYKKTGDPAPTSLIWDEMKLFPTAQVVNATLTQIAATSFEENLHQGGGWIYTGTIKTGVDEFKAGKAGMDLLGTAHVNTNNINLAVGDYIVSYWAKGTNPSVAVIEGSTYGTVSHINSRTEGTWTLYTKKVHVILAGADITITGSGILDEVRLYPVGAQMTTYTFDPLRGMTSTTDPNYFTSFYTYDSRNRLEYIKDFEGNILKRIEYHYQRDNN